MRGARFPDPPAGNLGPLDLSLDFLPPQSIGVVIDGGGIVSGGGFIYHDAAAALYAGVMHLTVHETVDVTAFGLIATQLPDRSAGYSLLVFITADGFQPIQLGLGFTLLAVGGMVGARRAAADVQPRRSARDPAVRAARRVERAGRRQPAEPQHQRRRRSLSSARRRSTGRVRAGARLARPVCPPLTAPGRAPDRLASRSDRR